MGLVDIRTFKLITGPLLMGHSLFIGFNISASFLHFSLGKLDHLFNHVPADLAHFPGSHIFPPAVFYIIVQIQFFGDLVLQFIEFVFCLRNQLFSVSQGKSPLFFNT